MLQRVKRDEDVRWRYWNRISDRLGYSSERFQASQTCLLGARTPLGAPGLTTRSQDATRGFSLSLFLSIYYVEHLDFELLHPLANLWTGSPNSSHLALTNKPNWEVELQTNRLFQKTIAKSTIAYLFAA